jgi:hypothetical protein
MMKLYCTWSEAIRVGIAIRPVQAFHKFYDTETGGTCANGAALEAIFGIPFTNELLLERWDEVMTVLRDNYSKSLNHDVFLPCNCEELTDVDSKYAVQGTVHRLDNIVVHLNNHHRWTREAIADWLESEEEKLGFVTLVEADSEVVKATQYAKAT